MTSQRGSSEMLMLGLSFQAEPESVFDSRELSKGTRHGPEIKSSNHTTSGAGFFNRAVRDRSILILVIVGVVIVHRSRGEEKSTFEACDFVRRSCPYGVDVTAGAYQLNSRIVRRLTNANLMIRLDDQIRVENRRR